MGKSARFSRWSEGYAEEKKRILQIFAPKPVRFRIYNVPRTIDERRRGMPVNASTDILVLSNTDARELAGRAVTIGAVKYSFQDYDPDQPGQPPWRTGAEGKAYPLIGQDDSVAAYLKFFTRPTQKRLDRTAWLISQQLHTWLPSLAAAPVLWTDTRHGLHGAKIDFQFAAYLAKAVPGETWLECKSGIAEGRICFPEDLRWRCVTDLLLALAALERAELIHGDLSPNNVILDLNAQSDHPAMYLIDFDAFSASAAGENQAITVGEGGTYGTEGYCPPDLAATVSAGDVSAAPYSDRFGRDVLILEFLLMGSGLPADDPLERWNREQVQLQFTAWQAHSDPKWVRALCHLNPEHVFKLSEPERPSAVDIATGLGLQLPERRVLRRTAELPRPTPAVLGYRSTTAKAGRGKASLPTRTGSPGLRNATAPVNMNDVFESLAPSRKRGSNITDEQTVFGCVMGGGGAIVIALLAIAGLLYGFAEGFEKEQDNYFVTASWVLGGLACLGVFILLCLALGYFVNNHD
jgi:hypothetical protein